MSKIQRTLWRFDRGEHLSYGESRYCQADDRQAELIGSLLAPSLFFCTPVGVAGLHAPALDIDFPVEKFGSCVLRFHRTVSRVAFEWLVHTCVDISLMTPEAQTRTLSNSLSEWAASVGGTIPVAVPISVSETVKDPRIEFSVPIDVRPSRTRGHFHLFIDAALSWEKYAELLAALRTARFIEEKYYLMAIERQITLLFLPGKKAQLEEGFEHMFRS